MTTIPVMRPFLGEGEAAAAAEAVRSGWVAQGPRVAEFERAFASKVGAAEGVAVSSCTTALHLALHLLDVGPGDDVVVPSMSFIATTNAVRYVDANPVFADIDVGTANLTAATVEAVLTPQTRAIILVHQGGVPADVDSLRLLCAPRSIAIVEDAACAIGSTYKGLFVGHGSDIAAWSFHPRKVITTGEGGMLTVDRPEWADRLRRLREHGMNVSAADRHASKQPIIESYLEVGFNYRMTDIQAAIGLVQLAKLDDIVSRRRELAHRYQKKLAGLCGLSVVEDPYYGTTNFQSCWVALDDEFPMGRDELLRMLADQGISARRGIMATHREPAYATHPRGDLSVTERLSSTSLILPLFHEMTEEEQDRVIDTVRAAAGGAR